MGKIYDPKFIRNISISGAPNVGKTTLSEALLFTGGQIGQMGSVVKGNTVMDFDEEEISKKMSLRSSLAFLEWKEIKINLVDTPGIPDLVSEVRSAFRVTEGIIFVVSAIEGITIDTEKDWHFADDYKIARVVFVNKMDDEAADFYSVTDMLFNKFKKPVIPIELPIGKGKDFKGVVDLVHMKAVYTDQSGTKEGDIPADMAERVKEYREKLFDAVAETDDALIEKFLNGIELTTQEVENGVKSCTLNNKIIPIICGSAINNIGTVSLCDTILSYLPSPLYIGEVTGRDPTHPDQTLKRHPDPAEPFSGFIFKTRIDPFAGKISFCRIRSGVLNVGDEILNVNKDIKERITHLFMINGKNIKEIQTLEAGDIAVMTKIESLETGNTVTDITKPLLYEPIRLPNPSYFVAIHSTDRKSEDKLASVFHIMSQEDSTFKYGYNDITKEMVVSCMGEIQARIIFDIIKHKYKLSFETRPPRVSYKETITGKAEGHYKHKKQSGGHGQYGEVYVRVEPRPRNDGFLFSEEIYGGAIPKNYVPAIEKGAAEACESGIIAGYPVVDMKVTVYDGSFHEVDSNDMSFRIAGMHATKIAIESAKPVILEPIAKVRIYIDENDIGNVMGDLGTKRGKVIGMDKISEDVTVINAMAPYYEMLSYSPMLNSLTSGRGRFEMEIDHYDVLPQSDYEKAKIQAEEMKKEEEDRKSS
jgi:elongation factor G